MMLIYGYLHVDVASLGPPGTRFPSSHMPIASLMKSEPAFYVCSTYMKSALRVGGGRHDALADKSVSTQGHRQLVLPASWAGRLNPEIPQQEDPDRSAVLAHILSRELLQ